MKFGPVRVAQAQGAVLAHSLTYAGGRIAKGHILTAADLDILRGAGLAEVVVARLDPGDVDEDTAAARVAAALVPDPEAQGLRITGAGAGRVNLYATGPGVIEVTVDAVHRLNAVDPMITLATVDPWHRVDDGGMVATIKIIAYAVPETVLALAESASAGALRRRAPVYGTATLIETRVTDDIPSPKGRAALTGRLDRLGLTLDDRVVVAHDPDRIAQAIAQARGDVIFILTGSATSDLHDVAPEGLRLAHGTVITFGMPVDPGNLLFLGALGDRPVIGLPGCARSPALNGADWVLERVICGQSLGARDIAAMGVGGLLKEIPTRPRPRGDPAHRKA